MSQGNILMYDFPICAQQNEIITKVQSNLAYLMLHNIKMTVRHV